jgi:outer membrane protein TolC
MAVLAAWMLSGAISRAALRAQTPGPVSATPEAHSEDSQAPLLTLDEAVRMALADNPALAAAEAGARGAHAGLDEARGSRWPRLEVSTDAGRTTNPVMVFGGLLDQERFSEKNFDVGFLNEPDPLTDYRARVAVSQPLWAGGRIAAGIHGAGQQAQAADLSRERARQELVYRVTDRYTGAVVAGQAVAVRQADLETATKSVGLTRDLYDTGLVVESDLLQARVREAEARAALAEAEKNAAVARSALNLELGREVETPLRLPTELAVPDEAAPANPPDLPALVAEAKSRRPDLAAARAQVAAARAGLDGARGGWLPEVGWSGAYEAHAESPFDHPGTNWSVGLGLRWTGFDGFATRARVQKAEAQLEQAQHMAELAERGVALEVESAERELEAARLRWKQAREAVTLAEKSVAIVRDRYKEGLTTVVELLGAEALVSGSRTRELAARRDLALAHSELDLAVGRL